MTILVTLWKYRSLILMGGLALAIAVLFGMHKFDQAALAGKDADIARLSGVVSGLNAQVVSLEGAVADKDRELAEKAKVIAAGDGIVAKAKEDQERTASQADGLRREIKDARDDTAALQLLAGGLCGYEARLAALHTGNNHEDGTAAASDTAGPAGSACAVPIGASGREIADYALRFAITAVQASEQIAAVRVYQDRYNAIVEAAP